MHSVPHTDGVPQAGERGSPGASQLPPGHPPIDPGQAPPATRTPAGNPGLAWDVPEGWVAEAPSSNMRIAQWRLSGEANQSAECAVFYFPGGGDVDGNISRWLGQFQQPDGADSAARARRSTIQVNGMPVHIVSVTGTYLTRGPTMQGAELALENHALFGAVIEASDMHFLKCTGPSAILQAQAPNFEVFLSSLRTEPGE